MNLIDGRTIAQKIKNELKEKVKNLDPKPGLAVVLVGDDSASKIYVAAKEKACQEIGYYSKAIILSNKTLQEELNREIEKLNKDKKIHGILVQLPLPASPSGGPGHLDEEETLVRINPLKDVDGLSPVNMGKLLRAKKVTSDLMIPATSKGILTLIKSTGIKIAGKKAVVIGRSNLVGKPVAHLLLAEDATVTICHSKTKNLPEITRRADILVVAMGKPKTITAKMVKKGAIVIDVGINRAVNNCHPEHVRQTQCSLVSGSLKSKNEMLKQVQHEKYQLVGDVDFEKVKKIAGYISPVPGGVGPMTIASLMENTLITYNSQV